MRNPHIEALREVVAKDVGTKAYGQHFKAVREAAGFPSHLALAKVLAQMGKPYNKGVYWLRKIEVKGVRPRASSLPLLAKALGVTIEEIDPEKFDPQPIRTYNTKAKKKAAAKAKAAKRPSSMLVKLDEELGNPPLPVNGTLAGIEIRTVPGGTLIRFEAVLPPGRDDLLHKLLLAAAAAKAP